MAGTDPVFVPAMIPVASLAAVATLTAQSAVQDGIAPTQGWSAGIIAGGVAVFVYLDRRGRQADALSTADRRQTDADRTREIERLQARLDELTAELLDAYRKEHPT